TTRTNPMRTTAKAVIKPSARPTRLISCQLPAGTCPRRISHCALAGSSPTTMQFVPAATTAPPTPGRGPIVETVPKATPLTVPTIRPVTAQARHVAGIHHPPGGGGAAPPLAHV